MIALLAPSAWGLVIRVAARRLNWSSVSGQAMAQPSQVQIVPRRVLRWVGALSIFFVAALPVQAAGACRDVASALLERPSGQINREDLRAFYDAVGQACAWDELDANTLISLVQSAGDEGLDPGLFHADRLGGDGDGFGYEPAAVERDILLTDAAIKYAGAMARGLSFEPPAKIDRAVGSLPNGEIINGLARALDRGDVASWFGSRAPQSETYRRLKSALAHYRSIAEAGGWDQLPVSLAGKRKSRHIPLLRQRLAMEGDLAFDSGSAAFDDELRDAVRRFQERNGLRVDGQVNAKTIERLNVSASQRVAQIALNLERLRLSERDRPATRVEVNAPAATAVLYRDGIQQLAMNAVVGAPGHDTPTLSSVIQTVVLNPQWTIPRSIIQNEIRPHLKRNPDYLTENRMYWLGDQLIQEPGPHNALGRIKFEFPNPFSVYLHDTPARKLFTDPERAQSHGCVRLERPLDLAAALLSGDPAWDREALEAAIRKGSTRWVRLSEPMPVVITYETTFVADDGQVQFRPDIYGLDTKLTLALAQRASAMRSDPAQW
jgi:murein L,D-transpeptidase YcbB/YkuD